MSEPVINVVGLSKRYRLGTGSGEGDIRELIAGAVKRVFRFASHRKESQPQDRDLWALRDISFGLQQGEVLGLVGRNGAGKSTLLKVLSRITDPTEGYVDITGRVGSLLEVGTGFHPELSGRENIFLNGAILGMRHAEVKAKFDEIVAFAEIDRFIDTPVKRYSSGMYVRLAFAVAAHLEPEILIVDEVLAVGDASFQRKCLGKMQDVAGHGRTVLFVSHNMAAVKNLCSRAIVLESGQSVYDGDVAGAIALYHQTGGSGERGACLLDQPRAAGHTPLIESIDILDESGQPVDSIPAGGAMAVRVSFVNEEPIADPHFGFILSEPMGTNLCWFETRFQHGEMPDLPPHGRVVCRVDQLPLLPGRYYLSPGVSRGKTLLDAVQRACAFDVVEGDIYGTGRLPPTTRNGHIVIQSDWEIAGSA